MTEKLKNRELILSFVAVSTLVAGILTLSSTLAALVHHGRLRIVITDAHLSVIAGISLIYLATLLRRGKHNAWLVSLPLYLYLALRNYQHSFVDLHKEEGRFIALINLCLPLVTLVLLITFRAYFNVRSELRSFKVALRRAAVVLLVAFLYGVIGFQLFDQKDFHEELPPATAIHYTLDQSGFTTHNHPTAYTRKGRFFVDSLAAVSITSVFYVAVSFFAPIRYRLANHDTDLGVAQSAASRYATTSEDFFKFWPREKSYFFNKSRTSVIAYRVHMNVALAVGDPVGPENELEGLIAEFYEFCRVNDWSVAFIHAEPQLLAKYHKLGFESQKIGEEALIDINRFMNDVRDNKYFRNIKNRFTKQGYSFEILAPPHHLLLISELKTISDQWLSAPGREERRLMMGYFSEPYMQLCNIAVVKDAQGKVIAFLNDVPSPLSGEANFDFLRHGVDAPPNINDFLMLNFIERLSTGGTKKLNMGLCPLAGLDSKDKNRSLIDSLLAFVYTNAGRFYSFQGLTRFKAKYEPEWQDRYIIYRGGVAGFGKAMAVLIRAMTV